MKLPDTAGPLLATTLHQGPLARGHFPLSDAALLESDFCEPLIRVAPTLALLVIYQPTVDQD